MQANHFDSLQDTAIISDQYNHASLILGSRMSGASITIFKHDGTILSL